MNKISKAFIWWMVLLFTWFFAASVPFHNIAMVLPVLTIVLMCNYELKRGSLVVPKVLILSIVFQNTIIGIAFKVFQTHTQNASLVTQIPFFIIFTAGLFIFSKDILKKEHRVFVIYLLIIALYCVKGGVRSISLLLYNIRNLTAFYLVYNIGKHCINTKDRFLSLSKFFVRISLACVIFGIITYFWGGAVYRLIGIKELYAVKTVSEKSTIWINGLPGNFNGDFFGHNMVRMGSFFLEPVNLSSFFALGLALSICEIQDFNSWAKILLLVVGIILTFGKGGLFIAVLSICSLLMGNFILKIGGLGKRTVRKIIMFILLAGGIGMGVAYGAAFAYNMHIYSIKVTFNALLRNPLGFGVGTVGNASNMVNVGKSLATTRIGAETGLLNIWCQIGPVGLILFLYMLFIFSHNVIKHWSSGVFSNYCMLFVVMPIILVMDYVFQENTFTIQVITGYMLFLGYFGEREQIRNEE